jgi:hypothetical protein
MELNELKNKLSKLEILNNRNNDEIILIKEDFRLKEYVLIEELEKQKSIVNSNKKQLKYQNLLNSPVSILKSTPFRSPLSHTKSPLHNTPVRVRIDRDIDRNINRSIDNSINRSIDNKENVQIIDNNNNNKKEIIKSNTIKTKKSNNNTNSTNKIKKSSTVPTKRTYEDSLFSLFF